MRFVVVGGCTETARIDGISAAGQDRESMVHTPGADLEIVEYGQPIQSPVVPVSPSGCPTPAVVTRAVRELLGFETLFLDTGLPKPTGAPTVAIGERPGKSIRDRRPVSDAAEIFEAGRRLGRGLPDDELVIGETIPGGTTTALAVLTALGERATVSSSLPENPLELKRSVVGQALGASDCSPGDTAGNPIETIRSIGDPMLAGATGLLVGATATGTDVTLAGGTQMAAVAALARHAGLEGPISLATTAFVANDDTAAIADLASDLDVTVTVTDPGFDQADHPAMTPYVRGEAKEGVGMGGALALAERADVPMDRVRSRIESVYDRLLASPVPGE